VKRLKRSLAAVFLFGTSMGSQADPSQYLCVVEQSAGFHYDKQTKSWVPQAFGTARKYVLRRVNDDDRHEWAFLLKNRPHVNWVYLELGNKFPEALCENFSYGCRTLAGGQVAFDQNTLRFELTHAGGYLDQGVWEHFRSENPDDYDRAVRLHQKTVGDPDNPADLYFEIGRCSPF
jgi:hypothetical protein